MGTSTFPRSGVLVLGTDSIQSLVPSTLISQVESLLDSHRLDDAVNLAAQQRKKLQGKAAAVDEDEMDELRYVHQRIGFQYFTETLFEDAGAQLALGELDPRVLVSYFPDLRGALFRPGDALDVFAGVAARMPPEPAVDDIIRNYSPHLAPNTASAPPTAELRRILRIAACDMLAAFLRRWRTRRAASGAASSSSGAGQAVNAVVDTVLAKLLAEAEKTTELYALLQGPNDVVVSELAPVLATTGQYSALCMLYQQHNDADGLLDVWSKLVDGEWTDTEIKDPAGNMMTLLSEKKDRALVLKWALWFMTRDPDRGIQLLTSRESGKRKEKPEDDLALLQQIQDANPAAAAQFLEYLVLQKRSTSPALHDQLANACIDQLLACLEDPAITKLWRAKAASYSSSPNDASFLSYFTATTPDTPSKRTRLRTILFLQGSALYDPAAARARLAPHTTPLALELAIVDGRAGDDRAALGALVHALGDAVSAEAYCALGGAVVPPAAAAALAARHGLQAWAPPPRAARPVDEARARALLALLLEVYVSDGDASVARASRLLAAQAARLDVPAVLARVPARWPLSALGPLLARSCRAALHAAHEARIVKALAAGENLAVMDRTWPALREAGALIEEAADEDDGRGGEGASFDEKGALVEKVGALLGA